MTASAWDKFLLLSWKNWIIQIRHPVQTIFEILVPILICAFLILIRGLVDINNHNDDTRYQPLSTTTINSTWMANINAQLIYSPANPVFARIVNNVSQQLGFTLPVLGLPNSIELLNSAKVLEPFASIEFEDSHQVRMDIFFNFFKIAEIIKINYCSRQLIYRQSLNTH